jgi:hypothetical protein
MGLPVAHVGGGPTGCGPVAGPPGPVHRRSRAGRIQANPTHAMRNMLERVAAEQKIRLTVAVETNSMDVQQRLAAAGVGFPPRLVEFVGNNLADGIL